jgi:hypothetical protein
MEENSVIITVEEIQDAIDNLGIECPVPILIIPEGEPKRTPNQTICGMPGDEVELLGIYSAELKVIELYRENIQKRCTFIIGHSVIRRNAKIEFFLKSVIRELIRGYQQHMWLENKFGEKEGLEKYTKLISLPRLHFDSERKKDSHEILIHMIENPMKHDSLQYALFGNEQDLDIVMEHALEYLEKVN